MNSVNLTKFKEQYLHAYIALNRQWIEHYFEIEPLDIAQLENPYDNILNIGGEIFFVVADEKPVGTCAMIPHGPNCFELAKLAVDPTARGKGYGDLLMKGTVAWAKEVGANKVILLSNTSLDPAIALYKKHGFKTTHLGVHADYKRCNIEMELILSK